MSDKININPNTVQEEGLLYRSLEERGEPVDALNLPEPAPSEEWLMREAGGDVILYGLFLSKEQNETAWVETKNQGLDKEEHDHLMDQYDLTKYGLHKAIEKRHQELKDKRGQT
jgi:hypothetical protein